MAGWVTAIYNAIVIPTLLVWIATGVFTVVRDSMSVLSRWQKRRSQLAIDDMLATSTVSDEEFLVGVLRVLLPPLWLRSAVGAVAIWLIAFLSRIEMRSYAGSEWQAEQVFRLGLITVGAIALTGALAGLIIALWLIGMGAGSATPLFGSVAGILAAIAQLAWLPPAMMLLLDFSYWDADLVMFPADLVVAALAIILLLAVLVAVIIRRVSAPAAFVIAVIMLLIAWGTTETRLTMGDFTLAELITCILVALVVFPCAVLCLRYRALMPVFVLGVLLASLGTAIWVTSGAFFGVYSVMNSFAYGGGETVVISVLWLYGVFSLANPLAAPSGLCYGQELGRAAESLFCQPWRLALLVLMQMVLVLSGAWFAREAIRQRRMGK